MFLGQGSIFRLETEFSRVSLANRNPFFCSKFDAEISYFSPEKGKVSTIDVP